MTETNVNANQNQNAKQTIDTQYNYLHQTNDIGGGLSSSLMFLLQLT